MADKRLTVLQNMSSITHSTDMDEFLRLVGLTQTELVETLKQLADEGYVTKTKHGYALAEKGKLMLKANAVLPDDLAFRFYSGLGQPTGLSASSVKEFYEIIKNVDVLSVDFHFKRGDFENWLKNAIKDDAVAKEFASIKQNWTNGEGLRNKLVQALEKRFEEEVLQCAWA